jgi:sulfonate transport system substrate-binding protein
VPAGRFSRFSFEDRHPMKRRSFSKALIAVAALIAVCGSAKAENGPEKIRFGSFGSGFGQPYGTGLIAIAQLKGFVADEFKDQKVALEWTYYTGTGPAINEAIANGQLDFGHYGALPNIIGRANGLPTHIVLSYGTGATFAVVRNGVNISSIRDLKGHRVSVAKATVIHLALLKALAENGLTDRDVTLVDLKDADQMAALAAGSVDAAFGTSSFLALRDQGLVKVIYSSNDGHPETGHFGGVLVTEDFEKKYPEATQRVVRGLVAAAHWAGQPENREEALRLWAKSGVSYQVLKEEFEGQDIRQQLDPRIDGYFLARYRDGIEFAKTQKLIRGDVDLAAWVVAKYQDAALQSLGLESYWPRRDTTGAATN